MYKQMKEAGYTFEDYGAEIDGLNLKLAAIEGNLSSCRSSNANMTDEFKKAITEKAKANTRIVELENQLEAQEEKLQSDMQDLRDYYEEKEQGCEDLQDDFDSFVEYMANNYCCKQKVDNPNIRYYDVQGNKVQCSESDGETLEC